MTETQLKKILKVSHAVWLCRDYFFNAGIMIHRDHLPGSFDPANESSYRLLGYKKAINDHEPDLSVIVQKIKNYPTPVDYYATPWLYESSRFSTLYRQYSPEGEQYANILIPDIYYQVLPLHVLQASAEDPERHPVSADHGSIIVMPIILEEVED